MSVLKKLKKWWTWWLGELRPGRDVVVRREKADSDAVTIRIVEWGASDLVVELAHRNDLYSMTAVMYELCGAAEMRTRTKIMTDVVLTYTPAGGAPQVIRVPDWAVRPLLTRLVLTARELGWRGQCPRPATATAYR